MQLAHQHAVGEREHRLARAAVGEHAQRLLVVVALSDALRERRERRARGGQVFVAKPHQPRDRTAAEGCRRHRQRARALLEHEALLRGVGRIRADDQLRRARAHQQPLAARGEQVHRAVVLLDRRHLQVAVELQQHLVALVEQVVRRLPAAVHLGDALVERRELVEQIVDVVGGLRDLLVGARAELAHAGIRALDPLRQDVRALHDHLARARIRGPVDDVGQRRVQVVDRGADAVVGIGEHLLEPVELRGARLVGRRGRGARGELGGEETVVAPLDGDEVHPHAEKAAAGGASARRRELRLLDAVAGRAGIGDIVAGGLQLRIRSHQRALSDSEQPGHGSLRQ